MICLEPEPGIRGASKALQSPSFSEGFDRLFVVRMAALRGKGAGQTVEKTVRVQNWAFLRFDPAHGFMATPMLPDARTFRKLIRVTASRGLSPRMTGKAEMRMRHSPAEGRCPLHSGPSVTQTTSGLRHQTDCPPIASTRPALGC